MPIPQVNNLEHLALDHLAIAVLNLDEASEPYRLMGFEHLEDELVEAQQVKVRVFRAGESLVELLTPISEDSPISNFLARRGPGLHHVAFRVKSLADEMARLQPLGAKFIGETPLKGRAGTRVIFLHPKWAGGVLIELVEHA